MKLDSRKLENDGIINIINISYHVTDTRKGIYEVLRFYRAWTHFDRCRLMTTNEDPNLKLQFPRV